MPDDTPPQGGAETPARARPTMLPDAITRPAPTPERVLTPPDALPSARPPLSWPAAMESALDKLSRRALRFAIGVMILKLQSSGKMSPEALVALTVCAVGIEAAVRGLRERKAATVAALAIPLVLGVAGHASGFTPLSDAAAYITAMGIPLASLFGPTRA